MELKNQLSHNVLRLAKTLRHSTLGLGSLVSPGHGSSTGVGWASAWWTPASPARRGWRRVRPALPAEAGDGCAH